MTTLGVTVLLAALRVVAGSAVIWLLTRLMGRLLPGIAGRGATLADDSLIRLILGTVTRLGYLAMASWGWQSLVRGSDGRAFDQGPDQFVNGALLLAAIVLVVRLINRALLLLLNRSMQRLGRYDQLASLHGLAPMIRTIIWLMAALVFLQNQGVEMGAVYASLAGAGIGLGLALKGPLSNFISYLTILLDAPFQIGDFIRFGDVLGPVEEVGLRSTIIRSLSGERIVINNDELLNQTIHNFSDLPRRRVAHSIGVVYQTPVEQVAAIPELVAQVVQAHPPAEFDRCHFTGFTDMALEFEFVFFVPDGDMVLYLDLQQKINLGLLRRFEDQGINFATRNPHLLVEPTGR